MKPCMWELMQILGFHAFFSLLTRTKKSPYSSLRPFYLPPHRPGLMHQLFFIIIILYWAFVFFSDIPKSLHPTYNIPSALYISSVTTLSLSLPSRQAVESSWLYEQHSGLGPASSLSSFYLAFLDIHLSVASQDD